MVLGIIGAGNIADSLIAGLIKSQSITSDNIVVSNYNKQKSEKLVLDYGVQSDSNENVIKRSDIIILSVKPYGILDVINLYKNQLKGKLIISLAAGISLSSMEKVDSSLKIVRAMVNTPVKICQGVLAYSTGQHILEEDKINISKLFSSIGLFIEVDESKMDAVSVLMGCSPAYIYQIIEAMSDAGVKMGLTRELSLELSSMAVMGSGGMVNITKNHPAILKDKVTSPAGSTIEGLAELENHGVRGAFISAVYKAYEKTLLFEKNK